MRNLFVFKVFKSILYVGCVLLLGTIATSSRGLAQTSSLGAPAAPTGVSPTLAPDFVLPAGSVVRMRFDQDSQSYKSVNSSGDVEIQNYYEVLRIQSAQGLQQTDKDLYNQAAAARMLFLPAMMFQNGEAANGSQAQIVTLKKDTPLYRASAAYDPAPTDPKVLPSFTAADEKDNLARERSLPGVIDAVATQKEKADIVCNSAEKAGVPREAYQAAMNCYRQNRQKFKTPYLVIMDLTKPSTEKRFFVIDAGTGEVKRSDYAMHGRGISGVGGSQGTPPGFHLLDGKLFRNGRPYYKGVEMKGLESRNSNSHARTIRLHDWGNEKSISQGYQSPTWGCIGLPDSSMSEVQNMVSGGSLMLNYTGSAEDKKKQTGTCALR